MPVVGIRYKPAGERIVDRNAAGKFPAERIRERPDPFLRAGSDASLVGPAHLIAIVPEADQRPGLPGVFLAGRAGREHRVAVERDRNRVLVEELVDPLVVREVVGHQEPVDVGDVRDLSREPDVFPIRGPGLYDPVRVLRRQRERRPVEVNDHPGNFRVGIGHHAFSVPEDVPGKRVAVALEFVFADRKQRLYARRDFCAAMRNGYQERVRALHGINEPSYARPVVKIWGCFCGPAPTILLFALQP